MFTVLLCGMCLCVVPMQLMGVQGACRVDPTNARDFLMIATQDTGGTQVDDEGTPVSNVTTTSSAVFSHPFVAGSEEASSFDCSSLESTFVSVVRVCVVCVCVLYVCVVCV